MNKRHKVSIVAAAVLLAGAAALSHFGFARPGSEQVRDDTGRRAIEECQIAARMVYDVHWAAACMAQAKAAPGQADDGHAECDLPEDKAAVVNAWLDEAEQRCMAEVRAGLVP